MTEEKDSIISDFLGPNRSKTYQMEVLDHSLLLLTSKDDAIESRLIVKLKRFPSNITIERCYVPEISDIYIFYIEEQGKVNLILTNLFVSEVRYSFFLDTSQPLDTNNKKFIPLKHGAVAFHVDLKKDDQIFLKLNPLSSQFGLKLYAPFYRVSAKVAGYMLRSLGKGSNGTLGFSADLEGRYYIIVESLGNVGEFSLLIEITSPFWNQSWFWPLVSILAIVVISSWLIIYFRRNRGLLGLNKIHSFKVIGNCCFLINLVLWFSSMAGYIYRISTLTYLFHTSTLFLGLGLGFRALSLYFGKEILKSISNLWYISIIFYSIFSFLMGVFFIGPDFAEWWGGIGSIIGALINWVIGKNVEKKKAYYFLPVGVLFFLLFPFLVSGIKALVFPPFSIELYLPELGAYIFRVSAPYQTIPQGFIFVYTIMATIAGFILTKQIKKDLSNNPIDRS